MKNNEMYSSIIKFMEEYTLYILNKNERVALVLLLLLLKNKKMSEEETNRIIKAFSPFLPKWEQEKILNDILLLYSSKPL